VKPQKPIFIGLAAWKNLLLVILTWWVCLPDSHAGTWGQFYTPAFDLVHVMSDGTLLAAAGDGYTADSAWYQVTPDTNGSYSTGTWTNISPMHDTRLYYASQVLTDGRLFVAGGEYGSGRATAEVYDPATGLWTQVNPPTNLLDPSKTSPTTSGPQGFGDSESAILPDGRVLVAPIAPATNGETMIFDPGSDGWAAGPYTQRVQGEQTWVKLPDGSILTVDHDSTYSERYIPAQQSWVPDAPLPLTLFVNLSPVATGETGPGLLLPNGRAFFLGGTGHTAIYIPSGNANPGNWVDGPDIPGGLVAADAPAAMLSNGKILCAVAPTPYVANGSVQYPSPTSFYLYDYSVGTNGAFTPVNGPTGPTYNSPTYLTFMFDLPDGNMLFTVGGYLAYDYIPDGPPLAAAKPTISSITRNADISYHLTGTGLNGICAGASYGDDAQMDSNYPLIRMTNTISGVVSYARTYNWSSTGVQTGSTPVTTEFTLPAGLFQTPGVFSLVVVANGVISDPVTFRTPAWVDFNYTGSPQVGSFAYPFQTMAQATAAVPVGGDILIRTSGSSHETMNISKPMNIIAHGGITTIGH
jgi:hypothetical protein